FFQAEDGIRDDLVTGVQTCALPILSVGVRRSAALSSSPGMVRHAITGTYVLYEHVFSCQGERSRNGRGSTAGRRWPGGRLGAGRSEERRVGKEWRSEGASEAGWSTQ